MTTEDTLTSVVLDIQFLFVSIIDILKFRTAFSYLWERICSIFDGAEKFFLAYWIRISTCFTCTYNSYLTHVISPGAG